MNSINHASSAPSRRFATIPSVEHPSVMGSVVDFLAHPVGFFVDAFHKHGPIFRVNFASSTMIIVAGALARRVLLDPTGCPFHREGLFRPFSTEVGIDVFDTEGEQHRRVRSLLKMPYSRQLTTQFVPEIEQVSREVVEAWEPGPSIDLFEASYRLALYAMMAVVTPIDLRGEEQDLTKAGNRVMYAQFGLLPEITLKDPFYILARRRVSRAIDDAIERHRSREFVHLPKTYLIDACLRASNEAGDTMDTRAIRGACFYALAGTQIYVGRMVAFMLFELLRNRSYMARVLAEIDSAHPTSPSFYAFRRMPYLRAAYHEALRCYPLIPGYSYIPSADFEIDDLSFRRGEKVVFAPYLSHFSDANYANPMAFDPERHLPPRRESARPDAFTPFGAGQHACAAQGIVETVTLTLVTSILRAVDLELERPSYSMDLRLRPLVAPKEKVCVRVRGKRAAVMAPESALFESAHLPEACDADAFLGPLPAKEPASIAAGEWLIREGEPADAFFVLLEGKVSFWKGTPPQRVGESGAGSCFGETGILLNRPRAASVLVERPSRALRFSREEFEHLIGAYDLITDDIRVLYYRRYIQSLLRSSLPGISAAFPPESIRWRSFSAGEHVFHQGDPSDAFFIIVEGQAEVIAEATSGAETLARLGAGEFFGEIGILKQKPRSASVVAMTPLKTLCIERAEFIETLSHSPEALSDLALTVCERLLRQVRAQG